MNTILVTGATGNQGGTVARHLLQQNKFQVQALVRDKEDPKAKALEKLGAKLVQGDFNDRVSLDKALQKVHGVFSIQDFRGGAETEIKQGKTLADAAKAAGIQHFVYSSVGSAERKTGIPHFESKFSIEEYIRTIGLPHTILRPVFFMYNYEGMRAMIEKGTMFMPLSPNTVLQQLSEEDYGKMVARVFERPAEYMDRAIELASTENTMTQVADTFTQVIGKKIAYQQIPFDAFQQQVGEEVTIMFRWFEEQGYNADLKTLHQEFGLLSSLETYLSGRGWKAPVFVGPRGGQNISMVGDTYRIIISGEQTGGAYSVINMLIPPGGGPGPHTHAGVQEAFYVIDGEIEVTTKAQTYTVGKGAYVNLPLNGPVHQFKNKTRITAHILCILTPGGMEKMFEELGQPVEPGVFLPPPPMTPELMKKFQGTAEKYGNKLYPPDYFEGGVIK